MAKNCYGKWDQQIPQGKCLRNINSFSINDVNATGEETKMVLTDTFWLKIDI